MAKLTDKQKDFCKFYLATLNATQAAIDAKYSKKTAQEQGSRLLSNVMVQSEIQRLRKKAEKKTDITLEKVLRELSLLAFCNMQDYMSVDSNGSPVLDFSVLTRDQAAALTEITTDTRRYPDEDGFVEKVKFKLADKRSALVDIGKHLGMFDQRQNEPESDAQETLEKIAALLPD